MIRMQNQHKQKPPTNPILNQLQILKQKLDQRGTMIKNLSAELNKQKAVTLSIIQEYQTHEGKILSRLHKLQEINIKYIKDYLTLKKQMQIDQFQRIDSIINCSPDQFFRMKFRQFKEELSSQLSQKGGFGMAINQNQESAKFVNNCTGLLRSFLAEKQPNYENIIADLRQQRRKKLKEVKGIDEFKKNKEEQKFIEAIRSKIIQLDKKVKSMDGNNMIEIFNLRKEIESDIARLDPMKVEMSLEDSQKEQEVFQQVIQEVVMNNLEDNPEVEAVEEQLLMGHYRSLEKKVIEQSQKFGSDFVLESIQMLPVDVSEEVKASIIQGQTFKQLMSAKRRNQRTKGRINKEVDNSEVFEYIDEEEDVEEQIHSKARKIIGRKKINRINTKGDQVVQYEDVFQSSDQEKKIIQEGMQKGQNTQSKVRKLKDLHKNSKEGPEEEENDDQQMDSSQILAEAKLKKQKDQSLKAKGSKLNSAFQTTMTKSFFKDQQKARDTLITKQNVELVEHEKVIDKLITFIKKEFKERKMDEIQGDDPEQLMGYYFRVNEKKIVDVKEEMKNLQAEKNLVNKENITLKQEKIELEKKNIEMKEENQMLKTQKSSTQQFRKVLEKEKEEIKEANLQLSKQNEEMKGEKITLEQIKVKLEEEKVTLSQTLVMQKEQICSIKIQNENFKLKLELQKLQILSLSQIYEGIKNNAKEFHQITNRTENIVKLSLQTLFNTCLNKLKPEDLVHRLQNLIQLIKVNMKLKSEITYQLSISDFLEREEEKVKRQFSVKISEGILPYASHVSDIKFIKREDDEESNKEKSEKSKSFSDDLKSIAYEILQRSLKKEDGSEYANPALERQMKRKEPLKSVLLPKQDIAEDFLLPLLSLMKPMIHNSSEEQRPIKKSLLSSKRSLKLDKKDNFTIEKSENQQIEQKQQSFRVQKSQSSQIGGVQNSQIQGSEVSQVSKDEEEEEKSVSVEREVISQVRIQDGKGLNSNFLDSMMERIREMKFSKLTSDEDLKQMYQKYKQALDCLERAEKLNKDNEMKYQQFLNDLHSKGIRNSPQSLEDKLFYLERVVRTQNQLIENQRKEYEDTIVKQVKKSQELAKDIIKSIRLKRKQTIR